MDHERGNELPEEPTEFDLRTVDHLLTTTRSVRLRLDLSKPVAVSLIDECLSLALQAPNGSGQELWRFLVVTDPEVRRQLGGLYKRSSDTYLSFLRLVNPDLDETAASFRSSKRLWDHLGDVPVHVIPCLETQEWHRVSPERAYADASVYGSIFPAMWSFQLACRSRGLGTCFVTSLLKHEAEMRSILRLPANFAIGGLLAVAHTSGSFSPAVRRPLDEVRRMNGWN
jgi:nitroreductase